MFPSELEIILSEENESNSQPLTKRNPNLNYVNQEKLLRENLKNMDRIALQNYEDQLIKQIKDETTNKYNHRYGLMNNEKNLIKQEIDIMKNEQLLLNQRQFQSQKQIIQQTYEQLILQQKNESSDLTILVQKQMETIEEKSTHLFKLQKEQQQLHEKCINDENNEHSALTNLSNSFHFLKASSQESIQKTIDSLKPFYSDKSSQDKLLELNLLLNQKKIDAENKRRALELIMSFDRREQVSMILHPEKFLNNYSSQDYMEKYQFFPKISSSSLARRKEINGILTAHQKSYTKLKGDLIMEKFKCNKLYSLR